MLTGSRLLRFQSTTFAQISRLETSHLEEIHCPAIRKVLTQKRHCLKDTELLKVISLV